MHYQFEFYKFNIPSNKSEVRHAEILKEAEIKKNQVTQKNLTQEEEALKEIRKKKGTMILKADKGNVTVIMNSTYYDAKVFALLNDKSTYSKLTTKSIRLIVSLLV